MRADIHDGQEHNRSIQGPDTEAPDHPPFVQIQLATHGRSIQKVPQADIEPSRAEAKRLQPTSMSTVRFEPIVADLT
jgi:hypothetical protein